MQFRLVSVAIAAVLSLSAQETAPAVNPAPEVKQSASPSDDFLVPAGTKVPLSMINSISTKTAA